jgi:hypothetical protein
MVEVLLGGSHRHDPDLSALRLDESAELHSRVVSQQHTRFPAVLVHS